MCGDAAGDFTQAEQPVESVRRDAGMGAVDRGQRHRFTMTGVWELPYRVAKDQPTVMRAILVTGWRPPRLGTGRHARESDGRLRRHADGNSSTDRPFVDGVEMKRNSYTGATLCR